MMNVTWKNTSDIPQIERGKDIKIWGLVDFYRYSCKWGGVGEDDKATRIATLENVTRRVVELRFSNTEATPEELEHFENESEFPKGSPGWLDEWCNEDGEFFGFHGFYQQFYEEGGMYLREFKMAENGKLQTSSCWNDNKPEMILLAWAEFEKPEIPNILPD